MVMSVHYDSLPLARLLQQSKKHMFSSRHGLVSNPIFQTKGKSRSLPSSPIPNFQLSRKTKIDINLQQESKFLMWLCFYSGILNSN